MPIRRHEVLWQGDVYGGETDTQVLLGEQKKSVVKKVYFIITVLTKKRN